MTSEEFEQSQQIILESTVEIQNIEIGALKQKIESLKNEKEDLISSMEYTLKFLKECRNRNFPDETE